MSERAPEKRLPRLCEPRKLTTALASFQRFIDAEDLPRLQEAALDIQHVWVDIKFERDDQGRPTLLGELSAKLSLQCQRCLGPMTYEISRPIELAIVWDEAQAKALPRHVDPWIVGEDEADLAAILEEEILLALPVVAKHNEDCLDPRLLSSGESEKQDDDEPNPFSVLAKLKEKN